MLKFKDFYPTDLPLGFLGVYRKYETLEMVLKRVNAWLDSEKVKVVHVETIMSSNPRLEKGAVWWLYLYLFPTKVWEVIRVWYEE